MQIVCGIDEAGRGPLAGPVTAAAVVLDSHLDGLTDSKLLGPARCAELAPTIMARAALWGIGWAWPAEIDRLNILQASLLAMWRAYECMQGVGAGDRGGCRTAPLHIDSVLVDGPYTPQPADSTWHAVVGGDRSVAAIQAASILAKTARDRWMIEYAPTEPHYRFELHKGYPTLLHREMIAHYGASRIQRHSFRCTPPKTNSPTRAEPR